MAGLSNLGVNSRCWTSTILLLVAFIALILPLFVDISKCSTPNTFSSQQRRFIEEACQFSGKYYRIFVTGDSHTIGSEKEYYSRMMPATTWVTCALTLMALAVQLPFVLWTVLNDWFGLDLARVAASVAEGSKANAAAADGSDQCPRSSNLVRRQVRAVLLAFKTGSNTASAVLLLLRKVGTIVVTLVVFIVVQALANPFSLNILYDVADDGEDPLMYYSSCRISTKSGDYKSFPCFHPANQVLRQLFIILSMYLLTIFLLDIGDLLVWIIMLFVPSRRNGKISSSIREMEAACQGKTEQGAEEKAKPDPEYQAAMEQHFVAFLGFDGFLLLILTDRQAGHAVWAELLHTLWQEFKVVYEREAIAIGQKPKVEETSAGENAALLAADDGDFKAVPLSDDGEGKAATQTDSAKAPGSDAKIDIEVKGEQKV